MQSSFANWHDTTSRHRSQINLIRERASPSSAASTHRSSSSEHLDRNRTSGWDASTARTPRTPRRFPLVNVWVYLKVSEHSPTNRKSDLQQKNCTRGLQVKITRTRIALSRSLSLSLSHLSNEEASECVLALCQQLFPIVIHFGHHSLQSICVIDTGLIVGHLGYDRNHTGPEFQNSESSKSSIDEGTESSNQCH